MDMSKFKKILVSGPQRSGTTIAGHIISNDLKYKYYDERAVGVRSLTSLYKVLLSDEKAVIQGPCFSNIVHLIDSPDTLVVFMIRNIEEIKLSQQKINWTGEKDELKNYFIDNGIISEIKYNTWNKYQKPNMKVPYYELKHESLSNHPMWISDKYRTNFRREIK